MTLLKKAAVAATLALVLSQILGCASSSLVNIWHDSAFQAPPLNKMMVIAVRKDATNRRIWEDAFSSELAKHDMAATPSYRLFPGAPPDTNQVISSVESNGFDGILVILNLPSDTNSYRVEGYTTIEKSNRYPFPADQRVRYVYREYPFTDQDVRYVSYWQRYRTYYREIDHPGYTDTQTTDIRAIDVTTTGKDGRLIWSATSRTPDPESVTDVQRGIVSLVLVDLVKQNVIRPAK